MRLQILICFTRLLVKDPHKRLTASQCLEHPWLRDEKLYLGILDTLETMWMRKCLARRRWLHTVQDFLCELDMKTKAMKLSPLLGPFCGSEFWGFSLLKI